MTSPTAAGAQLDDRAAEARLLQARQSRLGLPLFPHFVFYREIGGSFDIGPLKKACLMRFPPQHEVAANAEHLA